MKRRSTAHSAHRPHLLEADSTQREVIKDLQIVAGVMALACALLLAFGLYFWSTPDSALADDAVKVTTADESSSASSEASDDPGSDSSESSEGSDSSASSEPSDSSSSSSSSEDEGEDGKDDVGGIMLRVVDDDIADGTNIDDETITAPQGDASFAGMKFNVYKETGKLVKTLVVNNDGRAILPESDYLPLGTYTVKLVADTARERGYKANKTWADKGKNVTIDEPNEVADAGVCACKVIRGAILLNMVDSDLYDVLGIENTGQGKASLAEAEFEVYNASEEPILLGGKLYEPYVAGDNNENRLIMKLTTDEWGEATTDNYTGVYDDSRGLPWGTYLIKQTGVSKGYKENDDEDEAWSGRVKVHGEDRFGLDEPVRATVIRGGVKLQMVDAETEDGKAQGDATFKGATFEVINDNGEDGTIVLDGKAFAEGDVVLKVKADKEGLATCAKDVLPYGTYKVRMANNKKYRSYVYDKEWEATVNIKNNNKKAGIGKGKSFKAKVARGGVTLKQLDSDTSEPVGGAKIEIVNSSKKPVVVKGITYTKGKVVLTFSADEEGIAKTGRNVLPFGTYVLREVKPAPGYDLNKDWTQKLQIRKAKKIVNIGKVYETASPVLVETDADDGKFKASTILPILGILILAAAIAAAVFYRRRRQQEQELLEAALPLADDAAIDDVAFSDVVVNGAVAGSMAANSAAQTAVEEATTKITSDGEWVFTGGSQATQPVEEPNPNQTTELLDSAYYADDADATRALIDDQATRAMQAALASRAARERGSAEVSDAMSAETVALDGAPLVSQVTQVMSSSQDADITRAMATSQDPEATRAMPRAQGAETTRAILSPQDPDITLYMPVAQVEQPLPILQDVESTLVMNAAQANQAMQAMPLDESDGPTQPNHLAEAIEADQRARAEQLVQDEQDVQDQDDDQEFGQILPAVVTKSEQKRARRAHRWAKRDSRNKE